MDSMLQNQINKACNDVENGTAMVENLIRLIDICIEKKPNKETIHSVLDLAHTQAVVQSIYNEDLITEWFEKLVNLIDISQFHTGYLIKQRAERYNTKSVFNIIKGETISMVCLQNNIVKLTPFKKAIKGITKINTELLKVSDIMSI